MARRRAYRAVSRVDPKALAEFQAGTDPTNGGSILRVLTLASPGPGGARVLWSAAPGKSYRVQARDDLEQSVWSDLSGIVVANGTTGSFLDTAAAVGGRRFYRVVVEPALTR